jgi:hypothetical protein
MSTNRICRWFLIEALGLLGGEEVQTSVKFVKLPSPDPGSFLKAPMPLPMGEGGRRPSEGSVADRTALLGGPRLLATSSLSDGWFTQLLSFDLLL